MTKKSLKIKKKKKKEKISNDGHKQGLRNNIWKTIIKFISKISAIILQY